MPDCDDVLLANEDAGLTVNDLVVFQMGGLGDDEELIAVDGLLPVS